MLKDEYKNLKILYVEDEEFIRINAVSYLKRLFNHVYEASNAQEAISIIEEQNPHIVITDIKMPKTSGLDMIRLLREYDKKTKFIVLSAFTDTKYLLDAIDLGLVKYLTKPIRHDMLYPLLIKCAKDIFSDKESKIYISEACFFDSINNNLIDEKKIVSITKTELLFLKLLIKKHPSFVTYEELQNNIWYDEYMSENAIRLLVRDFRKKLPAKAIKNISKIGYKIDLL
jgi:YesN/AraC family two-component response regulator